MHTLATETVFHNADIMHTRLREFELQLPKADMIANFRTQLGKSISAAKQVLGSAVEAFEMVILFLCSLFWHSYVADTAFLCRPCLQSDT